MKKVFIALIVCISVNLCAKEIDFNYWLESEVYSYHRILEEIENESKDNHNIIFSTLRVRVRTTFKTQIPLIAKGKVRPEIELFFKK